MSEKTTTSTTMDKRRVTLARLWPHAPYAEDQKLSHPILYAHVVSRGFTMGTFIGMAVPASTYLLRSVSILPAAKLIAQTTFMRQVLQSGGTGALIGTGLMAIAVPMRMRGREEIEWQDRSWRLLENRGQKECDDWMYTGAMLGALGTALRGQGLQWRGVMGGVGVGSVLGVVGYMGYRYGIKGGKWDGDTKEV